MTQNKKKILIIEDEKVLLDMYADKLTRAGHKVFPADNIEKGLEIAKNQHPDLILLDIVLPEQDGIDFLEGLKKREISTKGAKIVAISNLNDPVAREMAAERGVTDYLMKTNYTPQEMVKKVQEYL